MPAVTSIALATLAAAKTVQTVKSISDSNAAAEEAKKERERMDAQMAADAAEEKRLEDEAQAKAAADDKAASDLAAAKVRRSQARSRAGASRRDTIMTSPLGLQGATTMGGGGKTLLGA